jgi:hypothetical protein
MQPQSRGAHACTCRALDSNRRIVRLSTLGIEFRSVDRRKAASRNRMDVLG